MENRLNWIIFLLIAFLIMIGHAYFFGGPPIPEKQTQSETTSQPTDGSSTSSDNTSSVQFDDFDPEPDPFEEVDSTPQGSLVTIDSPLYKGVIDTAGARFVSWELKDYKASANGDGSELVNLFSKAQPSFNALLQVKGIDLPEFIPYQFNGGSSVTISEGTTKELNFIWTSPQGITVNNIFELDASSYLVKQRFEITNSTGNSIQERLLVKWPGQVQAVGMTGGDSKNFITQVSDSVERIDSQPDKAEQYKGVITWFGFSEKYFMSSFLPETGAETVIQLSPLSQEGELLAQFAYPGSSIPNGQSSLRTWEVYMGPLEPKLLKPIGYDLDSAINYGWFGFLAKPMLQFLEWLNSYFHNYGISIIVITIIIRALFFPLTVKSMVSMKQMQLKTEKVKPEMDALKEKYKDDKSKQNTELMALYSKHGINPLSQLGGCLPLLIQFPVFIAIYDILRHSIDLRHSPFLWIPDLSQPDMLFEIPYIGIPFRLLPIIMGAAWFLSQKMTPMSTAMGGENMQLQMKLMQYMPIIFVFLFWNLPSGLVLYWTVSNILSIAQQVYVNRKVMALQGV
ncbi:MAG: membrane protein insertase YidC [Thermodesulfobacteriota bacterium]|nr:MAG: membrane protein insertase YidC [Thermodesulfobacteriota bacterium]